MNITKEEIYKTANLARLKISEDKFDELYKDLSQILDFVEQLNELDCSNVKPLFGITTHQIRERNDEVTDIADVNDLLFNAPAQKNNMFAIKKFVES